MSKGFQRYGILHRMSRLAHFTALGAVASLFIASTEPHAPTGEVNAAEVLTIQSIVAQVLDPPASRGASSATTSRTVLDVQRLLSGVSDSDERQPSTAIPAWWALIPGPPPSLPIDVTLVARLIEVPRTEDEGRRQQVQPFLPPPLSRVLERYRMMLTPHAPPQFSQRATT